MKITIVGDIMCEPAVLEAAKRPDGTYDFAPMYEKVVPMFREADYVIGNMETTLAGEELEYTQTFFSFNAPDSFGTAAKEAGIDLVSLINNHTLDRGAEGAVRTMETLDKIGLPYVGTTLPDRERQGAYYFERGGVRFAVVSYTYGINKSLTEDDPVAKNLNRLAVFGNIVCDEKIYPTSWVDELYPQLERAEQNEIRKQYQLPYLPVQIDGIINHEKVDACFAQMAADIREAKKNADFVIFFPHIGGQFNTRVGKFSEYAAKVAMEAGADAVVASHSHVLQRAEYVDGVPCAYSLGNFSMCPGFYAVEAKHLREYGLAAHLYLDGARVEKVTFSFLKGVYKPGEQQVAWPVDELYEALTSDTERETLLREVTQLYRIVMGKNLPEGPLQREYLLEK
ncbi:MAG: CapA family protein [Ruminococcaceae bacterium]|nr:CapA family protein [Oscillospiraceae bacterium]